MARARWMNANGKGTQNWNAHSNAIVRIINSTSLFHCVQLYAIIRYVISNVINPQRRQWARAARGRDSDNICGGLVIDQITWSSRVGVEASQGKSLNKPGRHLWRFSGLFFKQSRSLKETIYLACVTGSNLTSFHTHILCIISSATSLQMERFAIPRFYFMCNGMMRNFQKFS